MSRVVGLFERLSLIFRLLTGGYLISEDPIWIYLDNHVASLSSAPVAGIGSPYLKGLKIDVSSQQQVTWIYPPGFATVTGWGVDATGEQKKNNSWSSLHKNDTKQTLYSFSSVLQVFPARCCGEVALDHVIRYKREESTGNPQGIMLKHANLNGSIPQWHLGFFSKWSQQSEAWTTKLELKILHFLRLLGMEALAQGFGKAEAMFWIEMLRSWHPSWYIQRPEKHGTRAMLKSYPPPRKN